MAEVRVRGDVRPPAVDAGEKATLVAFLDYVREAVVAKAEGVGEEQGRAPGVPSGTSIFGLVKHLAAAEAYWFAWAFAGADVPHPDFGMDVGDEETGEGLVASYRDAVARANDVIARCDDLSLPAARAAGGADAVRSLRWILVHMIEETARHAGHVDILREQVDGSVGR
ncbi:DinB family protein [Streptomyces sp. NPDC050548]|uniref:DinB family protein n=1 Tax=Streptomyces sp. NPDC050548 TaxID=3365629 RepID=UPI0037B6D28E